MNEYSFIRIKDAFPTENLIGRWVIGLAVIHNDFIFLKDQLYLLSEDISTVISKVPASFKLIAASLREAIFYLEESEKQIDIKEYISELPPHILKLYSFLTPLYRTGDQSDLLQRLTNLRNITYHFSKPHRNEFIKALEENQNQIIYNEDMNQHFLYAELIRNSILIHSLLKTEEDEISELIRSIKSAIDNFIKFSREVNKYYLKDFL
ncbi:hypothetical protein A7K91_15055 [Paenibacillus oryzae]|uniref:Uncharacterized protein n=1 Tax=Paenibacillus oryzae TaxID=1844972 RepID=A0A1A5YTQ1_9BACL|nr:hypothetical protein [Paenibacillus oryzae]OBR68943.1 hypothetical protein A7K91_15055 [Paenibacillus oryzae]